MTLSNCSCVKIMILSAKFDLITLIVSVWYVCKSLIQSPVICFSVYMGRDQIG